MKKKINADARKTNLYGEKDIMLKQKVYKSILDDSQAYKKFKIHKQNYRLHRIPIESIKKF